MIMTSVSILRSWGPTGHTHTKEIKYEEALGPNLVIRYKVSCS